jgi:O-antigen ligase
VTPGAAAARPDAVGSTGRTPIPAIVLGEIALVVVGSFFFGPLAAASAALAIAFFLLAYRSPTWAWMLVWIAVPFDVERLIGGGVAVTLPTEPMILISLLAWMARGLSGRPIRLPPSRIHLPLACLGAWALASASWSVGPVSTIKAWTMMSGYVVFGYVFVLSREGSRAGRERWINLVALMGVLWGGFGIVRVFFYGTGGSSLVSIASNYSYGAFRPFFSEHGTYAAYMAMLLPPMLIATLESSGARRLAYGLSATLIGSGIVLAFARAAWFSLLVVLPITVALWAIWRREAKRLVWPAILVAAVLVVVVTLGIGRQVTKHATTVASPQNISNLERLNRWQTAILMTESRPLTGVGFGCYVVGYKAYRSKALPTDQTYIRMGAHSEPLKLLSETGIPGFILAIWFLVTVFTVGLRVFRNAADVGDRAVALAVLAGFATYVADGFFNAYLAETKVTVPFWAAIGVIAALERRLPRSVTPAVPPS